MQVIYNDSVYAWQWARVFYRLKCWFRTPALRREHLI